MILAAEAGSPLSLFKVMSLLAQTNNSFFVLKTSKTSSNILNAIISAWNNDTFTRDSSREQLKNSDELSRNFRSAKSRLAPSFEEEFKFRSQDLYALEPSGHSHIFLLLITNWKLKEYLAPKKGRKHGNYWGASFALQGLVFKDFVFNLGVSCPQEALVCFIYVSLRTTSFLLSDPLSCFNNFKTHGYDSNSSKSTQFGSSTEVEHHSRVEYVWRMVRITSFLLTRRLATF